MTYPPHPPIQPRRRKVWPWIVGGTAAVLIVIGAVSGGGGDRVPVPTYPADAAAPAAPAAPAGIGDGTWIVGTDIAPGTYRSTGARPGLFELCSATTKSGAASNADIIDWVTANANEPVIVEIGAGVKAFETSGCEPWSLVP